MSVCMCVYVCEYVCMHVYVCMCVCMYLAAAPHFSLELCCKGLRFTNMQEDGCDRGVHQSYPGTERNTPVIPNWFQPCQYCCCLCYPGEYLQLGTLITYYWAQVLEACDCLKLLLIYFNLCVDATGIVYHQLGLLGTDLHAVSCWGFVETHDQLILPVLLPLLLSHWCHQQSWNWWLFCLKCWRCLHWSSKASVLILSRNMLKRVGENRHSCWTLTVVRNQSPMLLLKGSAVVALS